MYTYHIGTTAGIRRRAGCGVSGRRNEFLRALVGDFGDVTADRAMPAYGRFAGAVARAELPPWFYHAFAISGLMPLIKAQQTPEEIAAGVTPDVRPVAIGEVDLRAIAGRLTEGVRDASVEVLAPQQLGVGVQGGISILIHGVRLMLEQHEDFVVVKLDLRNGFNAVCRSTMLRRMASHPGLAHLVPFMHALMAAGSDLFVDGQRLFGDDAARPDSSEGTQQGLNLSSLAFSVAIQPELEALDAELTPFGGCARAIMDDTYAIGPASVVFPALRRFAASLREMTGLELQTRKSTCWSHPCCV